MTELGMESSSGTVGPALRSLLLSPHRPQFSHSTSPAHLTPQCVGRQAGPGNSGRKTESMPVAETQRVH